MTAVPPLDPGAAKSGDASVDEALRLLPEADGRPTAEQAEVFDRVHRALQDALDADIR